MNARDLDVIAERWERDLARDERGDYRSEVERRADAFYERWRPESGIGCVPCLLEELE